VKGSKVKPAIFETESGQKRGNDHKNGIRVLPPILLRSLIASNVAAAFLLLVDYEMMVKSR